MQKIGRGTRNDVLEGEYGAGITDSSVDKDGNNLKQRMEGKSLNHSTGEIDYSNLVYLTIPHYDFNGNVTKGEMVVNKNVADEVLLIFEKLYKIKYPIEKMVLVDQYYSSGDSDFQSIEDNNTSAFNERTTDSGGPSNHAKGLAIDINPIINPMIYTDGGPHSSHTASAPYVKDRINMTNWDETAKAACINPQTEIYKIFTSYGWRWLGNDDNTGDTQHFDKQEAVSENNNEQINWDNADSSDSSQKTNKKEFSLSETFGEFLRWIWEFILTAFENLHTGREEEGVNFAVSRRGHVDGIDIDNFIYYYQGDPEWAGRPFANSTFGPNGCGPTSVAMILTNMSGERITPNDIVDWCGDTYSLMDAGNTHYIGGTNSWTILTEGIKHFGLSDSIRVELRTPDPGPSTYISISDLIEILKQGNVLVLVGLKRGIFTSGGHYIVYAGVYDDGTVIVRDPGGNGLNGRPGVIDEPYNNHHFTEQELSNPGAGIVGYHICYLE